MKDFHAKNSCQNLFNTERCKWFVYYLLRILVRRYEWPIHQGQVSPNMITCKSLSFITVAGSLGIICSNLRNRTNFVPFFNELDGISIIHTDKNFVYSAGSNKEADLQKLQWIKLLPSLPHKILCILASISDIPRFHLPVLFIYLAPVIIIFLISLTLIRIKTGVY